jgi:transposase-like protein
MVSPVGATNREEMAMAQGQDTSGSGVLEEVLGCDGEFLRRLVQGFVQEILEAEMSEHLQADRYGCMSRVFRLGK